MRRFVFLTILCALSLPASVSMTGCYLTDYGKNFCSGFQSGPSTSATSTIDLEPSTYGVSVNYGSTNAVVSAVGLTCKGTDSGLRSFTYGSSDMTIADVSPSGQICGGTWNRNSVNGVSNFTTCIPTNKSGIVYVTASGDGATSNPVPVFVHPEVTSVTLTPGGTSETCPYMSNSSDGQISPITICSYVDPANPANNLPPGCTPGYTQTSCISQNNTVPLAATVCTGGGTCTPGSANDITCSVGHMTFTPQNSKIVTVDQNGIATAHQPGATVITATVSQASSSAGYFFTCPPTSITLAPSGTNSTSVTVNQTNYQPLTATVLDTNNNSIQGLNLTFSSTNPMNITVDPTGMITAAHPGDADVVAQCLPGICNPSPQDQIGLMGAGMPVTSNPVSVHTPGPSSTVLYMASPQSYGLSPIDFLVGTVSLPVKLPYLPNSMVLDQAGTSLYIGSAEELMIVSARTYTLSTQNADVPGTVLAVSPDSQTVVIHDPCRQVFYLYNPAKKSSVDFPAPGPAIACDANNQPIYPAGVTNPVFSTQYLGGEVNPPYTASFTEDNQTLYITYSNPPAANTPNAATLFVYSKFTGWHACTDNGNSPATNCPAASPATETVPVPSNTVTVPGVGIYAASAGAAQVNAFSYCAAGPNNTSNNPNTAVNPTNYYPPVGTVSSAVDQVASTTDGHHILGATANAGAGTLTMTDIDVTIPSGACPKTGNLQFGATPNVAGTPYLSTLSVPSIANISQVLPSPTSGLAFVTFYSSTPGASGNTILPAYTVPATGGGALQGIPLNGTAGAPIAGVFSPDTNTFYVSTDQDNLIHLINTSTLADTQQINPNLADPNNKPVPAFFMAARPRQVE
jgi:hypothetical protein